jgi:hypothetical protein
VIALIDNAIQGLIGALITGCLGAYALWRSDRTQRHRKDELTKAYQAEITYLRAELAKCQAQRRRHP